MKKWSVEDNNYLRTYYGRVPNQDLCATLGRSWEAVKNHARSLHVKMPKEEVAKRLSKALKGADIYGEKNNNWKGGRSKDRSYYDTLQILRYPERVIARQKVQIAKKSGKLIQRACAVCGEAKTEAHHEDYSKPLEVVWLCSKCHREVHKK